MTEALDVLASKITELADAMAEPAAQAALEAARMEGYAALAGGAVALCVAGVAGWGARKLWNFGHSGSDAEFGYRFVAVLLIIACCIAAFIGVWSFVDPRTWTTIASPELWLAKRFLQL